MAGQHPEGSGRLTTDPAQPLSAAQFDVLMQGLGPLGAVPTIAVAVSGGADSLALAMLLHDWTGRHGGRVTALTVDHGLRPDSAAEARRVATRLRRLGIAHKTLTWSGDRKPRANLQAAARAARYALLTDWCASQGVLYLALAQHRDDQAETLLLRLGRGSGLDGLAAMPAVAERDRVALLRPLLTVPKDLLTATLRARGGDWIEDPSNHDPRHGRVRIRSLLPDLAAEGLTSARLATTAGHLARARMALENQIAGRLAASVSLHPAGFAMVNGPCLLQGDDEVALRALARLIQCVGGGAYAPRLERLERLHAHLLAGPAKGTTLGGCRVLPHRHASGATSGGLLVVREAAKAPSEALAGRDRLSWDNRFEIKLARGTVSKNMTLQPLGRSGPMREGLRRSLRASPIPAPARNALPALLDRGGVLAVPQVGYWRAPTAKKITEFCRFAPKNILSPVGFTVA